MTRLLRPRHLAITVVLFLALSGAGLGIASATGEADAEGPSIHIPLPMQGDRGVYGIEADDSFEMPAEWAESFEEDTLEFRWFEDRMLPDQQDRMVLSNRLRYHTEPNQVNGVRGPIMEAGSNVPFAHESVLANIDVDREEVDMRFDHTSIHRVPCFLRNDLQGRNFTATQMSVTTSMPCHVSSADPLGDWALIGFVEEAEPPVLVFRAERSDPSVHEEVTMWMQDGLAYPLRVETYWEHKGQDRHEWSFLNYTFQGYMPGNQTIATAPVRIDLPPLKEIDWGQHGPDDRALYLEFPLHDAISEAQTQMRVQEFLDANPDAYLAHADHTREIEGYPFEVRETWNLAWIGSSGKLGHEVMWRFSQRHVDSPVPGVQDVPVPFVGPETAIEHDVWEVPDLRFPSPGQVDLRGPSPNSMRDQWRRVVGDLDDTFDIHTWGFTFGSKAGVSDTVHTWFGQSDSVHAQFESPVYGSNTYFVSWGFMMGWNGTQLESYQEHRYDSGQRPPSTYQVHTAMPVQQIDSGFWSSVTPAQAAGITVGALVVAVLYWLSPLAKGGMFGALFSRIQPDAVLEHPGRKTVYEAVLAEPGIHHSDLRRKVGMGQGTVTHHVDRLLRAGLLQKAKQGRYSVYFARGTLDHGLQASAGVLRAAPARKAFDAILARPGIRSPDLLDAAGVKQSTLHYHLKRLADEGLLEARREGKFTAWYPTESAFKVGKAIAA